MELKKTEELIELGVDTYNLTIAVEDYIKLSAQIKILESLLDANKDLIKAELGKLPPNNKGIQGAVLTGLATITLTPASRETFNLTKARKDIIDFDQLFSNLIKVSEYITLKVNKE